MRKSGDLLIAFQKQKEEVKKKEKNAKELSGFYN